MWKHCRAEINIVVPALHSELPVLFLFFIGFTENCSECDNLQTGWTNPPLPYPLSLPRGLLLSLTLPSLLSFPSSGPSVFVLSFPVFPPRNVFITAVDTTRFVVDDLPFARIANAGHPDKPLTWGIWSVISPSGDRLSVVSIWYLYDNDTVAQLYEEILPVSASVMITSLVFLITTVRMFNLNIIELFKLWKEG